MVLILFVSETNGVPFHLLGFLTLLLNRDFSRIGAQVLSPPFFVSSIQSRGVFLAEFSLRGYIHSRTANFSLFHFFFHAPPGVADAL